MPPINNKHFLDYTIWKDPPQHATSVTRYEIDRYGFLVRLPNTLGLEVVGPPRTIQNDILSRYSGRLGRLKKSCNFSGESECPRTKFTWISLHKPSPFWRTFSAMTHILGVMFATWWTHYCFGWVLLVHMIYALKNYRGATVGFTPHFDQVIAMPLSQSVCLPAALRRYSAIRWGNSVTRATSGGGDSWRPWKL